MLRRDKQQRGGFAGCQFQAAGCGGAGVVDDDGRTVGGWINTGFLQTSKNLFVSAPLCIAQLPIEVTIHPSDV